jgi:hypothetical protein
VEVIFDRKGLKEALGRGIEGGSLVEETRGARSAAEKGVLDARWDLRRVLLRARSIDHVAPWRLSCPPRRQSHVSGKNAHEARKLKQAFQLVMARLTSMPTNAAKQSTVATCKKERVFFLLSCFSAPQKSQIQTRRFFSKLEALVVASA